MIETYLMALAHVLTGIAVVGLWIGPLVVGWIGVVVNPDLEDHDGKFLHWCGAYRWVNLISWIFLAPIGYLLGDMMWG